MNDKIHKLLISPEGNTQKGFTIIELLLSTTIFSIILLLCSAAIIQIGRTYTKGIIATRTQETARLIVDDISKAIQFNGDDFTLAAANGGYSGYCVGTKLISYKLNQKVTDSPVVHAMMVSLPLGTCGVAQNLGVVSPVGQEKLGTNMRLSFFSITPLTGGLYKVTVRVVYGDDDLLDDSLDAFDVPGAGDGVLDTCKNIRSGSQFCAVSELTSVIQKRVK